MSLCVLLLRKNEVYMAGESRVTVEMNNKYYRWHDDYTKIEQVDDYVIFKGGKADLMNTIMDRFKESDTRDLVTFQQICFEEYNNFKKKEGINFKPYSETNNSIASSVIATFENNEPIVYFIADSVDFNLLRIELPEDKDLLDITLGVNDDEARKIYLTCNFDFSNFDNVIENYRKIYEGVTDEQVGGVLSVVHITNNEIKSKQCELRDSKNINQFSDYLLKYSYNDVKYKTANSITIIGEANVTEALKIHGVNILDEINKIKGDYLSSNSVGADKLKISELFVGAGGIRLDPSATISWNQVTNQPVIPVLPSYITSTKITSTTIESPFITGGTITGTTINVNTDLKVGNRIYLNESNFQNGIIFKNLPRAEMYYDPAGQSITLSAPGGVYAGSQRIDTALVAVFG